MIIILKIKILIIVMIIIVTLILFIVIKEHWINVKYSQTTLIKNTIQTQNTHKEMKVSKKVNK